MDTTRKTRTWAGGAVLAAVVAVGAGAEPPKGAFAWSTPQTLRAVDGKQLTWEVAADGDEVKLVGRHPRWAVVHKAKVDGTPLHTEKSAGGRTVTVRYRPGGAEYQVKSGQSVKTAQVKSDGLWDSDTLDARLAGVAWGAVKQLRFKLIDTDSDTGEVFEFQADWLGQEPCSLGQCHHVKVELTGWRRPFGPTIHYLYGTGPGAPYARFTMGDEAFFAASK